MSFNAGTVPGPLLAVRRAADKAWAGQGYWGPAESCGRIDTDIIEQGPLFVRWRTRYLLGGRELARYEMTLLADEDFVQVREATAPDTGMAFRFVLSGADAPRYWCTHGGGEQVKLLRGEVSAPPPRLGLIRPGVFVNIDFQSGHFQSSYAWLGLWRDGGPLIGVAELRGGHWQLPGRNRISVHQEEAGLAWYFAANGGSREYALTCGEPEQYAPAERPAAASAVCTASTATCRWRKCGTGNWTGRCRSVTRRSFIPPAPRRAGEKKSPPGRSWSAGIDGWGPGRKMRFRWVCCCRPT